MKRSAERLRKLEHEHKELKQILDLKLVPSKEIDKFEKELATLEQKIREEQIRLDALKEGDEEEEIVASKRAVGAKPLYEATLPEMGGDDEEVSETSFEASESYTVVDASLFDIEEGEGGGGGGSLHDADETEHDHWADGARWKRLADFERDAFEE